jgi:molybdopterin-containing oxidoreductase family membrane subunit
MFMMEKALVGSRRYWTWVGFLLLVIATGSLCYLDQLRNGLGITGMSRNVSWGLYIAQFTFFVGIAASAVMVVLPYYLHDVHAFRRVTILGELLAVSAVTMCMLFIFVDMGQPMRVLNVLRYPTFHSVMFWDMVSLSGYLLLNATISVVMLTCERNELPTPHWIHALVLLSIPWAVSIHTVTAFLYCGLPGRPLWLTAILAPRFLASAFAAGPSLLILLCLLLRRLTSFDVGQEAVRKLAIIVAYAMSINVFFVLLEFFTGFYSGIPQDKEGLQFLFVGLDGNTELVPWMWASGTMACVSLVLLLVRRLREQESLLAIAAALVFGSLWIEKGLGLIIGGFEPSPLGTITRYVPTAPEIGIVVGVWAIGALMVTVFYKITVTIREAR